MTELTGLAYGPVPSRRLGKSLGINNVLPKICSYSCAYCQLGYATGISVERRFFYDPEDIFNSTKELVEKALKAKEKIDYLCFVPDGEPTLDVNLGKAIKLLRKLEIPIGVITNSSLLWRTDAFLEKAGASDDIITQLVNEGKLRKIEYNEHVFYLRKFSKG